MSTVEHGHDVDDDADAYKPKTHKKFILLVLHRSMFHQTHF